MFITLPTSQVVEALRMALGRLDSKAEQDRECLIAEAMNNPCIRYGLFGAKKRKATRDEAEELLRPVGFMDDGANTLQIKDYWNRHHYQERKEELEYQLLALEVSGVDTVQLTVEEWGKLQ